MSKLVYCIFFLISLLPFRVLYILSDIAYCVIYKLWGYRRLVVRNNLVSSFPEKNIDEIKDIEHQFYHWFCDYFFEAIKLLSISNRELNRRLHVVNPEVHEQWFQEGRNTAAFLGHYCNWEWLSRVGKDMNQDRRLCLIYDPLHSHPFNNLFLKIRTYPPTGVPTPKRNILRQLLEWKQKGIFSLSGYIADQAPKWQNIHMWLPFLNHPYSPVFTGAERIARKMNNVIYYAKMRRSRRGYYEMEYVLITDSPNSISEGVITQQFFSMLEASIRDHPEFYLWTHNRWKRTKEEFDRHFDIVNGKIIRKDK